MTSERLSSIGLAAVLCAAACSTHGGNGDAGPDAGGDGAATCSSPGGPVSGGADIHCAVDGSMRIQPTDPASCHPADAMTDPDAGGPTYGDTMNGAEADDDDCKYHLKWSSTPVCRNANVTFALSITRKSDGKPAAGADPMIEAFYPPSHLGPDTNPKATETSAGNYTIGPLVFDQAGKWTVRFHMYGDCEDTLDDSPHGHAAFYLDVP